MIVPDTIFRQYDIRGVVGDELTAPFAHALGRALATIASTRVERAPRIAVGRDNRPSGEMLASALRDGMAAAGGVAVDVGIVPSPALYLSQYELDVDGGVQVTGSHNPPEFNGFKMMMTGGTLHGDAIQDIKAMIQEDRTNDGEGSLEKDQSMLERYRNGIVERNGPLSRKLKVVLDCGNGVGSVISVETLEAIGAEVVPLFCESDGTFPNHHPDPTVPENLIDLQNAVIEHDADVGIAFDGDADRIGIVDEKGKMIFGDQLLALYGRDLVHRMGKGHPIIFDVKCSDVLDYDLKKSGLEPIMWKTGHSLIKAKMKETNSPLAGEMSGHMFFGGDYHGFDDALFGAARLLAYLARQDETVSEILSSLPPRCSTPELRIDCPDDEKFGIVEKAAKHFAELYDVLTMDGARINFPEGWGLIRSSNTQPVLVMRFEASTEELLATYRAEVEDWLKAQGVNS
jgi:phosphomannomutase/phosphoglucomutase